jgi:hypothetical protein
MIYRANFIIVAAFVFCQISQLRAEDQEPFAVIELGAATERSMQDGTYGFGPSASVEFPVIKDWLEIETGISPLFRPGQTEWQVDLLFKKPFTINAHVEFMVGVGPQLTYATAGGWTKIASEFAGRMASRFYGLRKLRGKIRTSCPLSELSRPVPEIPVNWSEPRKPRSECWKSILRSGCPD